MLPDEPLTDGTVTLRPWHPDEAGWYAEQAADPEILRFTSEPAGLTAAAVRAAIEEMLATRAHAGLVVTDAATGALLGNAGLAPGAEPGTGAVSYWVAPAARGRGVATRAVRLLVAYAAELGLRRLTLWTRADNTGSRRVAEAAGFRLEGVEPGGETIHGADRDVARYALER